MLTKAIQDQQAQIGALQTQIKAQHQEITALKTMVQQMEAQMTKAIKALEATSQPTETTALVQ